MIALTTPINIPNITRLKVAKVDFDEDNDVALVTLEARSPGSPGRKYGEYRIAVLDGDASPSKKSQRVAVNGASSTFGDAILIEAQIEIPSGYTALRTAWFAAGVDRAARLRTAEQRGIADGWIAAALGGVVS